MTDVTAAPVAVPAPVGGRSSAKVVRPTAKTRKEAASGTTHGGMPRRRAGALATAASMWASRSTGVI